MATEWVDMTHPDVGDAKAPVTREAYDLVWSQKGWREKGSTAEPQSRLNRPKPEGDK